MVKNFRHVGIVVNDLQKALRFYRDIMQFKIVKEAHEDSQFIDTLLQLKATKLITVKLEIPDGKIVELLSFEPGGNKDNQLHPNDKGITHFALSVQNLDAEYQRLKNHDVEFLSAPQISPDGYAKVVFCRDFENNLIELVEVLN